MRKAWISSGVRLARRCPGTPKCLGAATIVTGVGLIHLTELGSPVWCRVRRTPHSPLDSKPSMVVPLGQPLMKLEEDYIKTTLEHVGGNRETGGPDFGDQPSDAAEPDLCDPTGRGGDSAGSVNSRVDPTL